ncbi:hypothetical protein DPMN_191546 [Dreissena polymorpha]|uniref:Uncharacterized protein n=2 Tax=Dreissena polymorpha TaxID=45954 RepID=A0A9D4B7K2_DREPO|nr:hypothetical protein DPMN_191546 [Dreissena polymorpha]
MGCYQDSGNRVLTDYDYFSDSNAPAECSKNCSNYKFFGVEARNHCLCGNTIISATQALESECRGICPGNISQICGADRRINLYKHWGCPLGSYSVNCSKQCHCLVSSCDDVTGECENGGCKDGWKGISCNEKCGGVLTDPFGVITSHNFPSYYNSKVHCTWVINAPEGCWINGKFTDFALEYHSNCIYDYLELFNGPNASYPSIGKFCGTVPPMQFTSQSNSVCIVFSTDSDNSERGFRLTYTISGQAKETTASKPSTTVTISIPTATTSSPTRNTTFATTLAVSSVLGVVLVAVIIFIVVCIRRRHRQSTGGVSASTESSPENNYDDLLTSRDPGNYDFLQMTTRGQQGCTN